MKAENKDKDNELVVLGRIIRALEAQDIVTASRIISYLASWNTERCVHKVTFDAPLGYQQLSTHNN